MTFSKAFNQYLLKIDVGKSYHLVVYKDHDVEGNLDL